MASQLGESWKLSALLEALACGLDPTLIWAVARDGLEQLERAARGAMGDGPP